MKSVRANGNATNEQPGYDDVEGGDGRGGGGAIAAAQTTRPGTAPKELHKPRERERGLKDPTNGETPQKPAVLI